MTKKIAIIDGYGFVFRAYHSLPPLTNPSKTPVGAVYGFTNMLIKLLAGLNVTHIVIALDSGSKTFRNDIYPQYKANRPECPEDLKPQFPIIREAANALNIKAIEKKGYEADDIIATIAKDAYNQDFEILIVSSDKDLMQLINDKIFMYDAMRNRFIRENEVIDKFFVPPNQVLDVLSLIGDSSDNVPGVRGIGPKIASELIKEFSNLENLLENYDQIKQDRKKNLIKEGISNAKLSKTLITLNNNVDIDINCSDLAIKPFDPITLIKFLSFHGFNSLLSRIKKEFNIDNTQINNNLAQNKEQISNKSKKINKILIDNSDHINKIYNQLIDKPFIAIDYCSLNNNLEFITLLLYKNDEFDDLYYFKINSQNQTKNQDLFNQSSNNNIIDNYGLELLQKLINDDSIIKIFFDFKNFYKSAINNKNLRNILTSKRDVTFDDINLMNHLLTSSTKNQISTLITANIDNDNNDFYELLNLIDKNKELENISEDKKLEFLAFKNQSIYYIYQILKPQIFAQKLNESYCMIEKPLILSLARMQDHGVKIDISAMKNLSDEFSKNINQLTSEIHQMAGCDFNIASTKQLSEVLFDKMQISSSKKSKKTGNLSTNSAVLEELSHDGHEIANKILDFRKFSKLKNTYSDALPKEINHKTNRIHSNFSSTSTITGRLSSSNPNLQNIPIRSIEGKKIRQAFIANQNNILISADYSQIELRIIAHMAQIQSLIDAFKEDKDIHKITASQVFNIHESEVSQDLRSKAKAINFGIIYGISAFGLAKQLKISRSQASDYIKSYLATYPGIDKYMKESIQFAKINGYVKTIANRKCFLKDINNKNPIIKGESERLAINAPIQGSAADLIKKAMIKLDNYFYDNQIAAKIIMQIHDELVIETNQENQEQVCKIIKNIMENAFILDLPLKVDINYANNLEK